MPASRWNSDLLDFINAFDPEDQTLEELFFQPIVPHVVQEGEASPQGAADESENQIPSELPILPLRGLVVYPQTAVPLTIGQPRSIRLVDDVVAESFLFLSAPFVPCSRRASRFRSASLVRPGRDQ